MALETNDLRRGLDDAYDDAQAATVTLREQLRLNERAAGALLAGGSLSSVSKNSASQSYAFGRGQVTTADLARGWRDLIDLYDRVFAAFSTAGSSTADSAVVAEMRLRLQPVREFTKDFSRLVA